LELVRRNSLVRAGGIVGERDSLTVKVGIVGTGASLARRVGEGGPGDLLGLIFVVHQIEDNLVVNGMWEASVVGIECNRVVRPLEDILVVRIIEDNLLVRITE